MELMELVAGMVVLVFWSGWHGSCPSRFKDQFSSQGTWEQSFTGYSYPFASRFKDRFSSQGRDHGSKATLGLWVVGPVARLI